MKTGEGNESGDRLNQNSAESFSEWFHSWRYLFWLLGLAGLIALFYAEENWRGQRAWRLYKQRLTARGENFEPSAFIPPRAADDENFAMTPALVSLFNFIPGTQQWRDTNAARSFQSLAAQYEAAARLAKPKTTVSANSWIRARTDLALWAAALGAGTNRTDNEREPLLVTNFSTQDAPGAVLRGLADYGPVLEELQEASRKPYARFNIHYEEDNPAGILLPHLSKIKQFCLVLQLRAAAELGIGRTQDALKDVELMLYLTDTSRNEPILISQLVRMAELQLALQPLAEGMGRWSEPQLRSLQEALQRFDFCADIKHALQAERTLFGSGIIEWVRRSPSKIRVLEQFERTDDGTAGEVWPVGFLLAAAPDGWLYLEQRNQSRAFDQYLLPLIDVTNHQIRPDAVRDADASIERLTKGSQMRRFLHHELFCGLLLPSISRVAQKAAFAQTAVDTAVAACALERYRLVHSQLPDALEKLSPEFISFIPHDVINGEPLRYRVDAAGKYLIYSVGWNQKDDGGSAHRTKGGDPEPKEGDWVWSNF
jgi:hypothetical protein